MEIRRNTQPRSTLSAFADEHNLVMVVNERRGASGSSRYYAHLEGAEVGGDGMLRGAYGNGATEEDAIAAYIPEISEKTLVIDAYKTTRRELKVPLLVGVI